MRKIPELVSWLYWFLALLLFAFVARYYVWIMIELYLHQEMVIFEYNPVMNQIELGVACMVGIVVFVSFLIHLIKLAKIISS